MRQHGRLAVRSWEVLVASFSYKSITLHGVDSAVEKEDIHTRINYAEMQVQDVCPHTSIMTIRLQTLCCRLASSTSLMKSPYCCRAQSQGANNIHLGWLGPKDLHGLEMEQALEGTRTGHSCWSCHRALDSLVVIRGECMIPMPSLPLAPTRLRSCRVPRS
jgi:hypothetical protein